jgi:hypothetical protein
MEKREFVIANCAEGLCLFDQECKDKASESEGPIYYLQTLSKDYELVYEERNHGEKDYYLEFYNHKMVEVSGKHIKENIIKVNRIRETYAS